MKNIPIRHNNFSIREVRNLDMVQELHRHDFFYILALEKGQGTHEIDFISYEVADNMLFFIRPGQVHQLALKAGCTGYMMTFKTDNRLSGNLYHLHPGLLSILTYIFQEYTDKKEAYLQVIKANLDILFIELARQNKVSLNNNYQQERLQELLTLIEKHLNKQVSEYADMMNLSVYQLNAITKTTIGKTCSALINEYIILEAKRYLLATTDQINQIAYHLGYEDASYFIRFFKKHTGSSPEAFRNKSC